MMRRQVVLFLRKVSPPIFAALLCVLLSISQVSHVFSQTARQRRMAGRTFDAEPALTFAACYGDLNEVTRLIDEGTNPNVRDWLFQTPLHLAAKFNRLDVVKFLVNRRARVSPRNRDYEETPLHLAAKGNHLEMINFLLDNGADIEAPIPKTIGPGGTPLLYASSYANSADAVNLLISRGAQVNVTNSFPQSALHHAVEHQNIYLAYLLINKHHIDKEIKDEWGNTALNWLVKLYSPPQAVLAKLLILAGANIETRDNNGRTPLHNACMYGHLEVAALLISNGANVNPRDVFGHTPLYSTIVQGTGRVGKITRLLLKHGADPNVVDRDGCDQPLFALARNQKRRGSIGEILGLARLLIRFGANPNRVDACVQQSAYAMAAKTLQWNLLELFRNATIAPLEDLGDQSAIDKLDPRKIASDLMIAAAIGDVAGVRLALVRDNVRNVDFRDYRNQTALHFAAQHGHAGVALALLQNGADVSAVDSDGKTPLHNAAMGGHVEMLSLLLSHGADANAVAENGAAPIHYAIDFRNSSDVIKVLLDNGANVSQNLMPDIMTPLHLAVVNQNFQYMELLFRRGADINAPNVNGATPLNHLLMSNCCYPQLPIVGFLLDRGADIEAKNSRGWTPLHMAIISKKRYQVIEYLLFRGANPNAVDIDGCNAPLFLLVSMATVGKTIPADDIAELLIDYGANYTQVDNCLGLKALDVALDTNQIEVVRLLRAHERSSRSFTIPIVHNSSSIPLY